MKTDQAGLEFISKWEGERLSVYKDIVGVPTIGIGHAVLPGESFPNGITHETAISLLEHDVAKCEKAIADYVTVKVSQNQYNAMCSLAFNIGTGVGSKDKGFVNSTCLRKLLTGDIPGAANAILLFCKADGRINQGLLRRRQAERAVFLTPDKPAIILPPAAEVPTLVIPPSIITSLPKVTNEDTAQTPSSSWLVILLGWLRSKLGGGSNAG